MAGFQFSLKNSKVTKPGKGKVAFLLKKGASKPKLTPNVLGADEDDDEPKKTAIDAFDSKDGALEGDKVIGKKEDLVIVPAHLTTGLLKTDKPSQIGNSRSETTKLMTADEQARESLKRGDTVTSSGLLTLDLSHSSERVEANTEKDYEDVPVEDFGAALLRGMGWDGKETGKKQPDISHRQRGLVLGIGSKLVGKDLEQELMMKRGAKLSVPLIRKDAK